MKPKKKWFDKEFETLKTKAKKLAILKHKNPWDNSLRDTHRNILKEYKNTYRTKKYQFQLKEISKLNESFNKNINFWDTWNNLGENKTSATLPEDLDGEEWEEYFESLFSQDTDKINTPIINSSPPNLDLNSMFTMQELKNSINKLKNNKACGPDGIPTEFIKHASGGFFGIILTFLNLNLEKEIAASDWCLNLISPIHKAGPIKNPENYRGICVINSLLEILCSLMNDRLTSFSSKNNLINKEQIGFKKYQNF